VGVVNELALVRLVRAAKAVECHEHVWFNPDTRKCEPLPEPGCPECNLRAALAAFDVGDAK
jgi:hypothetical protein